MVKFEKIILMLLILTVGAFAQSSFKIKYVSSTHVYLNGGKRNGLAVGDILEVRRKHVYIGKIKVDYVSGHSASCTILEKKNTFRQNDVAIVIKKTNAKQKQNAPTEQVKYKRNIPLYKPQSQRQPSALTRVQGYFSLQFYHFKDLGPNQYDFTQPSARFRIRIRNLWQQGFSFELSSRSRYNQRKRRFSEAVPRVEWQNRIYQFNFSYNRPQSLIHFSLGRIISNVLNGVGYIDGALFQFNLKSHWHLGAFAGTQPDWRTSKWQSEIQKYGTFITFKKGEFGKNRTAFSLAATGEYHGQTVSREFLFFRGSYYHGRRWNIYQHVEVDLNRGWRKRLSGQSLSLTGLYFSAQYNITRKIGLNVSYDNRKNYYTYEIRSIADSLFDDAFRHGLRARIFASLFGNYLFAFHFGIREKQTDSRFSYNYGFNITNRRFFSAYNLLLFRINGFDNLFANGINPSLQFRRRLKSGHSLGLTYGNYFYAIKNGGTNRLNHWFRLSGQLELPARLFSWISYEYDWGNDVQGHRIILELGYRF